MVIPMGFALPIAIGIILAEGPKKRNFIFYITRNYRKYSPEPVRNLWAGLPTRQGEVNLSAPGGSEHL
jgi:hypothetical protein